MLIHNLDKTAFKGDGFSYTYSGLLDQIGCYSEMMAEKDSRIVIFSENRPEYIFALYGAWKNQNTVIPVDYLSSPDELAYIIDDASPVTVYASRKGEDTLNKALKLAEHQPDIVFFEDIKLSGENKNRLSAGFDVEDYNATALIIYTSGTTGSPKGVMLTFANLFANIEAVADKVRIYSQEERVMMLLPVHHIFPMMGTIIIPFYAGSTVALCPTLVSEDILTTLKENKITIIIGVPRLYNTIRKNIMDKIRVSKVATLLFKLAGAVRSKKFSQTVFKTVHTKFGGHLKYLVSGGAAISKEVVSDFQVLGFEMLEGYGMSEAAPMITFTRPSKVRLGSAGQPVPGVDVEVRDGEIVARGKNIMAGYFNRPGETAEVIRDGWLHTGDLGNIDPEGYVYITGRKKEIIVLSNGKNINPEEVEKKLVETSPAVKETGVFAMKDALHAVIYPDFSFIKSDNSGSYYDYFKWKVIDVYNHESSSYKKIHGFTLVNEELPKTRLGKIRHFELERFAEQVKKQKKDEKVENFKEYEILKKFIEEQFELTVHPSDHIEMDLAIDSLGLVNLSVFVHSSFGVNMKENDFAKFDSVLKLAEFIREKRTKITVEDIRWAEILKTPFHLDVAMHRKGSSILRYMIKIFLKTCFTIRAEGITNVPDTPCIITPNHQSIFDGFFLNAVFRNRLMKKTYFYAKEKHFSQRWLKKLAGYHNVIVMEKNTDLRISIQKLAEILKRGKNIVIFPEGTRSTGGDLGSFKKTFAILSRELKVPVVPVIINGSKEALPVGSWFPRLFSKIDIKILQPVYPENHSYDSLQLSVHSKIERELKN